MRAFPGFPGVPRWKPGTLVIMGLLTTVLFVNVAVGNAQIEFPANICEQMGKMVQIAISSMTYRVPANICELGISRLPTALMERPGTFIIQ